MLLFGIDRLQRLGQGTVRIASHSRVQFFSPNSDSLSPCCVIQWKVVICLRIPSEKREQSRFDISMELWHSAGKRTTSHYLESRVLRFPILDTHGLSSTESSPWRASRELPAPFWAGEIPPTPWEISSVSSDHWFHRCSRRTELAQLPTFNCATGDYTKGWFHFLWWSQFSHRNRFALVYLVNEMVHRQAARLLLFDRRPSILSYEEVVFANTRSYWTHEFDQQLHPQGSVDLWTVRRYD